MFDRDELHRDGYILLRDAIPSEWLDPLRATFDANVVPSHQWRVPRGMDWRHALLDLDPTIQAVCRLPSLLEAVGELIGERFLIGQVEGREPLPGCGQQGLHRDLFMLRPGDTVNALAYFDDFGPDNGATRLVPGTHRSAPGAPPIDLCDESRSLHIRGHAGDVLVFDADLVHAASLNRSGTRRRTILIGYFAESCAPYLQQSAELRSVRMATDDRFAPAASANR